MTRRVKVRKSYNLTQREERSSSVVGVVNFVENNNDKEMTKRIK